jgi:opacity protein-like surface antigen
MGRSRSWGRLAAVLIVAGLPAAASGEDAARAEDAIRARDERIDALEQKVDLLVGELARVREQVAVPEEKELESAYGFGPAASKIYGIERGLSIGGYGEAFYTNFVDDEGSGPGEVRDQSDALRFVTYMGYKFTDRIVMNTEIEFEHGTTSSTSSSSGGSVSVEFLSLDFFWRDELNARAGLLLLPMGFLNEIHEPPFFFGVQRPETERRILPSTWRENGVGVFGRFGESLEYRSYVVTGFDAEGFSDAGIRNGRQNGNRSLAEDLAWVTRLDWTPAEGLLLGGSFYTGSSGQKGFFGGDDEELPDARMSIAELHAQWQRGALHTRALLAASHLGNADDLNDALDRALNRPVAEKTLGGYAEVAYDLWPLLSSGDDYLAPFVRVEYVDTQYEVPSGFQANRNRAFWLLTPGLSYKPHPNVVLKAEWRNFQARDGDIADELSVGMGFAF